MDLTAADVMTKDITVVEQNAALGDAVMLMADDHISALPVVDSDGRCVGLISAHDVLNFEERNSSLKRGRYFDPDTETWETVATAAEAIEQLPVVPVAQVMSRNVLFVTAWLWAWFTMFTLHASRVLRAAL
jgi:CBS-domain-containing membrane protein